MYFEQRTEQLHLNSEERDILEAPPPSHRLTLDGHCALAADRGQVVLYDVEGAGLRYVDPSNLDPRAWIP
jgi:hypothetical protein